MTEDAILKRIGLMVGPIDGRQGYAPEVGLALRTTINATRGNFPRYKQTLLICETLFDWEDRAIAAEGKLAPASGQK